MRNSLTIAGQATVLAAAVVPRNDFPLIRR